MGATTLNNQRFQQGGSILHLAKFSTTGVLQNWRDFGTVKVIEDKPKPRVATAKDSRSGKLITIDKRVIENIEICGIDTINLSLENLIYMWGATSTTAFAQGNFAVACVAPFIETDSIIPITDPATGNFAYNIASITSVKDQTGTAYTAGTDYIVDTIKLQLGYIYIPPTSTINASSVTSLTIAYTSTAITASNRVIFPWTDNIQKVSCRCFWLQEQTSAGYTDFLVREFVGFITVNDASFADENYGNIKFDVEVLGVPTSATGQLAGRVILPVGQMPTIAQP